jgi:hypothetical protein
MRLPRNLGYALLATFGIAACYIVVFHGFDAVVKGVQEQMRIPDAGHSTKMRPPRLIVPLI